jgi:hypothetical protein
MPDASYNEWQVMRSNRFPEKDKPERQPCWKCGNMYSDEACGRLFGRCHHSTGFRDDCWHPEGTIPVICELPESILVEAKGIWVERLTCILMVVLGIR